MQRNKLNCVWKSLSKFLKFKGELTFVEKSESSMQNKTIPTTENCGSLKFFSEDIRKKSLTYCGVFLFCCSCTPFVVVVIYFFFAIFLCIPSFVKWSFFFFFCTVFFLSFNLYISVNKKIKVIKQTIFRRKFCFGPSRTWFMVQRILIRQSFAKNSTCVSSRVSGFIDKFIRETPTHKKKRNK